MADKNEEDDRPEPEKKKPQDPPEPEKKKPQDPPEPEKKKPQKAAADDDENTSGSEVFMVALQHLYSEIGSL